MSLPSYKLGLIPSLGLAVAFLALLFQEEVREALGMILKLISGLSQ